MPLTFVRAIIIVADEGNFSPERALRFPQPAPPLIQETIYSEVIMTQGYTENQKVLDFVKDSAELAQPDKIVWIDGSEAQIDALREEACSTGEMLRLNQEKLPAATTTARRKMTSPAPKRARSSAAATKGRRPHQLLDGPQGSLPHAPRDRARQDEGQNDVRHPLFDGRRRLPSPASASRSPTPSTSSSICAS